MKPKTLVFLVVVLGLIGLYVVVRHTDLFVRPKPAVSDARKEKRVFATRPGEAKSIAVFRGGEKRLAMSVVDGLWRLSEPFQGKVDQALAKDLASMMADLRYERLYEADSKDITDSLIGLDNPDWTVELADANGASFALDVGRAAPTIGAGAEYYVRPKGARQTFVVSRDLPAELGRAPSYYREKAIWLVDSARVSRFRVEGRQSFELSRADGAWRVEHPYKAAADANAIGTMLNRLASVRAVSFIDETPASMASLGLADGDEKGMVLTVWLSEPSTSSAPAAGSAPATAEAEAKWAHRLVVGLARGEEYYARLDGEPGIFTISKSLVTDLQPQITDLRDRAIARGAADGADRISAAIGGVEMELVRKDYSWRMTRPIDGPVSSSAVQGLLDAVAGLKGYRFFDSPPAAVSGLDSPRGKITIGSGQKAVTLLVGAADAAKGDVYVSAGGAAGAATIRQDDANVLLAPHESYWEPEIARIPYDSELIAIQIDRPGRGAVCLAKPDANWVVTSPLTAPADANRVQAIVDRLRTLRADKVVSLGTAVPDKYAGADGLITVKLTLLGPAPASSPATESAPATSSAPATRPTNELSVCLVKIADKCYVWTPKGPTIAVGEMAAALYDDLMAELRDRKVASIKADDVERIKIAAGENVLELKKQADDWRSTTHPYAQIDRQKVSDYLTAIAEITAENFADRSAIGDKFKTPALTVEIQVKGAEELVRIVLSASGPENTGDRYALVDKIDGVPVLSEKTAGALGKTLKDFEK